MGGAILYPVFAQIALTLAVLFISGLARRKALLAREVTIPDIALDHSRWPDYARKISNNYSNQFELPVIFYVLCLTALQTGRDGAVMVLLAWAFVASRTIHAYIHCTSNYVHGRALAFVAGYLIIIAMLLTLFVQLLLAGA
jgi:hypothetical protein